SSRACPRKCARRDRVAGVERIESRHVCFVADVRRLAARQRLKEGRYRAHRGTVAPVNPRAKSPSSENESESLETVARSRKRASRSKPTIKAVAERAGVAISTVSRVVNGGAASKLARERVLEAIRELGYSPSVA